MTIALTGTVHDPDGLQLPALERCATFFRLYAGVYLAVSPETDPRLHTALATHGVILVGGGPEIGTARRAALRSAVAAGHDAFLAIDFDRWLHWAGTYSDELAAIPRRVARQRPRRWYVCLGRTRRAFATHPLAQRLTETVTNTALSLAVGRRMDAAAGAAWLSREGADLIPRESIAPTAATDLEWPALIFRADRHRLGQLRCDGLEFETAAFHADAIAAAGGLDPWVRQTYDHPASWQRRTQLAADSIAALGRVLDHA
ncbi:MAG: hypothetical protein M3464_14965 [Chloroflexota bacterium]|nr:hypothetical protein [Chloroflexota bacterium]